MKRAVFVGIDDYPLAASDLCNCVNDITKWRTLLMEDFGFSGENIRWLKNEEATKARVMEDLEWLKSDVHGGDTLVFVFSGHGMTFAELAESGHLDEEKDEALRLYGWRDEGRLVDDELSRIFCDISSEVNLTIICDCCFSGGISDNAPITSKRDFGYCLPKEEGPEASSSQDFTGSKSLLLAACREGETSNQGGSDTEGLSVFSFYAIQALRSSNAPRTPRELIERVVRDIAKGGRYSQTPQLKGRQDLFDEPLFG
jgi:hypothetical protein